MKNRSIALAACALIATAVGACQSKTVAPASVYPTSSKAILPGAPPALRLPDYARPLRYDLDLTLDPSKEGFSGVIGIDLSVREATQIVWLNARNLRIREAKAVFSGQTETARVIPGGDDFVGFAFDRPIGPGAARLTVAYEAHVDDKGQTGLYRVKENTGDWYLYSEFEPIDARHAFPCFDEPSYKVPWKLTFHVKKEHVALANAKVQSETPAPDGMKTVVFEESKPLPSYLVALVVGPFDVIDAGTAGNHGTPLRFVVPKGRGAETRYAKEITPKLVGILEDYFDMPYPYGKLDVAVVPRYDGTMEHPGLVAVGQPLTLIKPDEETPARKQEYWNIAGHELGHYWFGDYVTLAWWDDTYLNEAFTTWLDLKVAQAVDPSSNFELVRLRGRSRAMSTDSLASSKRVRQPIASNDDMLNAFVADITYFKGSSVIRMFENFVGREKFQKMIRRYVRELAWKNATTEDFLSVFGAEAGQDVATAFKSFIDQSGLPMVTAEPICGKDSPPQLLLTQSRYMPIGSTANPDQRWDVPVCAKYGTSKGTERVCTLLKTPRAALTLEGECPDWVMPNEHATGYYRTGYTAEALSKLVKKAWPQLDAGEKIALISDTAALTHNGMLGVDEALALLPAMLKDADRHTIEASFEIVDQVRRTDLRPEQAAQYAKYVRGLYGAKVKALGWVPRSGDDTDTRFLRSSLLQKVGMAGDDPAIRKKARELVSKWFTDHKAIDPEVLEATMVIAANAGDRDLWNRLRQAARETHDRNDRSILVHALGSFRDPALIKESLGLLTSGEIEVRDGHELLESAFYERGARDEAYTFVRENFDKLAPHTPGRVGAILLRAAAVHCDKPHHDENVRFFTERAKQIEGGPQMLENILEKDSLCIARREKNDSGIAAFLKSVR
ncbi:M1 family metallopeptidase [Pendulispora brunnea]|uniref:Aminopeptidase n=1 Tax=Pendulispora brunnea TaxID=2905690 RepID=A0ABZ2K2Q2_9BACT